MAELIEFDLPASGEKIIKVIGVGGGGGKCNQPHVPTRN